MEKAAWQAYTPVVLSRRKPVFDALTTHFHPPSISVVVYHPHISDTAYAIPFLRPEQKKKKKKALTSSIADASVADSKSTYSVSVTGFILRLRVFQVIQCRFQIQVAKFLWFHFFLPLVVPSTPYSDPNLSQRNRGSSPIIGPYQGYDMHV
ncbi:hypothetical protein D8B26_000262 [Coccidioides posadasii str. Silveira]|uniref:uncharacterized protein n=1 Tax=Coccidioides posadasii (strain RMSCC 757 / Silveira) TaxID=443226 RepID=UPI001BF07746|nr:hypothetical protein D8B26_000262 [Coccidioides posadasii str. Silveira]